MVRITSDRCSITWTACSASNEESRKGYGKRSNSARTSAREAAFRSIPIAPGFLLIPHPTSSTRMRTDDCNTIPVSMLIEVHQTDDVCILRFEGRFTTGVELEYLRGKADELKQQACGKVLVDFREVASVGSTAIGFIVAIYSSVIANPEGRFVLL